MKQITAVLLLVTLLTQATHAQIRRTTTPAPQKDTAAIAAPAGEDKMTRKEVMKELQLDRKQKGKLKEMRQEAKSKKEAIENDDKLTPEEKEAKLKALRREQGEKMNEVLTDEQKEKLKKIRKEKLKEEKPRRGVTGLPNERGAGDKDPKQQ
jgi:Spy/CpxP family protein refolding chaperone